MARRLLATVALALALWSPGTAFAEAPAVQTVTSPAAGTHLHALLEGLKLVRDGRFDDWVGTWCSTSELCFNPTSIASLKKYNLPAMQRVAPQCLKGAGETLEVTRIDGDPAGTLPIKVFLRCDPAGMPRPFELVNQSGWKFKKI